MKCPLDKEHGEMGIAHSAKGLFYFCQHRFCGLRVGAHAPVIRAIRRRLKKEYDRGATEALRIRDEEEKQFLEERRDYEENKP